MRGLLVRAVCFAACGAIPCGPSEAAPRQDDAPIVLRIQIQDEPITPVTARFVKRALQQAEQTRPQCLVIELDTPGGLLQSTQEIVTAILTSRVPVVVFVCPSGGRAASAGLFIALSSHIAAMAPGTRIGAAHPVQVGGLPLQPTRPPAHPAEGDAPQKTVEQRSPMEVKLVNDTQAWARGLARMRGRNADWAALAVTESRVLLSSEAVEQSVVELEVRDLQKLLEKLHGREVPIGQTSVLLRTSGAQVRTLEMWWGERRAKVIHAEGEHQAASPLRDAARMIEDHPVAMQMRFLQTLVEVGSDNNTTIVFPVPLELASTFLKGATIHNSAPPPDSPQRGSADQPVSRQVARSAHRV